MKRFALSIAAAAALSITGCMLFMKAPKDLDYSRTQLSSRGVYRGTIQPVGDTIRVGRLHSWRLRLETPDPSITTGGEDDLWFIRFDYEAGGADVTVAGFPAWEADEGLWVDLGEQVFVVQPILFFADDPPDAHTFLAPGAELALERLEVGGGS